MNFWESIDYNNSRKVLVIPNITNSSNIDKDSFVDVIHNHIKALDSYGDYYWNILMPTGKISKKLNLPNVKQHQIDIPGDMMNQRSFPSSKLINLLKDIDYDVIYSHLPDWVQAKIILASDYLVKVEAHFNATKKQDEPKQPNPEEEQEKPPVGEPPMAARVSPVPSPALNPKTAIGFALGSRPGPQEEGEYT